MTDPAPVQPEHDVLPPEPSGALSVPPPVPQKKPGFLRRLFMSRKKQQALAIQDGYLEMVDLIRAIRSHLDRQETVQTSVLSMLEKVPDVMERQHEVMTIFKQQLENGMENNRRLTDSMGNLNNTLASMDESQRASSRTITDLIGRSRETEQLLREVMRRAERRMTILLVIFFLLVVGLGLYFARWQYRTGRAPLRESKPAAAAVAPAKASGAVPPVVAEKKAAKPVAEKAAAVKPAAAEKLAENAPAPMTTKAATEQPAASQKPSVAPQPAEADKAPEQAPVSALPKEQADRPAAEKDAAGTPSAADKPPEQTPPPAVDKGIADKPAAEQPAAVISAAEEQAAKPDPAKPAKKEKHPFRKKSRSMPEAGPEGAPAAGDAPAVGQPDLTLDQIQQATGQGTETAAPFAPPADKPVSMP